MLRSLNTKMFDGAKQFLQKAMRRAQTLVGTYSYICINCDPQVAFFYFIILDSGGENM